MTRSVTYWKINFLSGCKENPPNQAQTKKNPFSNSLFCNTQTAKKLGSYLKKKKLLQVYFKWASHQVHIPHYQHSFTNQSAIFITMFSISPLLLHLFFNPHHSTSFHPDFFYSTLIIERRSTLSQIPALLLKKRTLCPICIFFQSSPSNSHLGINHIKDQQTTACLKDKLR